MSDHAEERDAGPDRRAVLASIASLVPALVVVPELMTARIPGSARLDAIADRTVFRIAQGARAPGQSVDLQLSAGELLDPFALVRQLDACGPVLIDADVEPANEVLLVECVRALGGAMPVAGGDVADNAARAFRLYT